MKLPEPKQDGAFSLEKAISLRRSTRDFSADALRLEDISQLLWAAQGATDGAGKRAAPSAGACYPLQTYLVAGKVEGLEAGIYGYDGQTHELKLLDRGDQRSKLGEATPAQPWVAQAPISLIISHLGGRIAERYGARSERYTHMEAGHAAQNVYLEATALGLGTVAIGAFSEASITHLLWLMPHEKPLYIMPVGKPAQGEKID
jgi:SagB-type dehydrogenase family enzyme